MDTYRVILQPWPPKPGQSREVEVEASDAVTAIHKAETENPGWIGQEAEKVV